MQKIWIKSIRIENFKSYKNLLEIGPLNSKKNIITGLNGTGKSNLIDAFLFIFGKRASKIRFNKLYQLIHISDKQNKNYASVNLTLNVKEIFYKHKRTHLFEISISRQIFSNNFSIYYLNGKEISFFEINKIFQNFGISILNDYFFIKQNEIETISLFKPTSNLTFEIGLLEYIENIFKTSRYVRLIIEKKIKIKLKIFSFITKLNSKKKFSFLYNNLHTNFETKTNPLVVKLINLKNILFRLFLVKIRIFSLIFLLKKKLFELKTIMKSLFCEKKKIIEHNIIDYKNYNRFLNGKEKILFFLEKKFKKKFIIEKQRFFLIKYTFKFIKEIQKKNLIRFIFNFIFNKKHLIIYYKKLIEKTDLFKNSFITNFMFLNNNLFLKGKKYNLMYIQNILNKEDQNNKEKNISYIKTIHLIKFLYFSKRCCLKTKFLIIHFLFYEFYYINRLLKEQYSIKNYKLKLILVKKKITKNNINIFYKTEKNWLPLKNNLDNLINRKIVKKKYLYHDNHSCLLKNMTGVIGIIGSFGYIKFHFLIAILAIASFELKSFIIDTIENAANVAKILKIKKIKRTAFIVIKKLGYLNNFSKNLFLSKDQFLLNKIYFNKNFKLPFFFIFKNTVLTKNLSEAISISLNDFNRKKTVTLDGKTIEVSGLFSGGGFKNNKFPINVNFKNIDWAKISKFYFSYKKFTKEFSKKFEFLNKTINKIYKKSELKYLGIFFKKIIYYSFNYSYTIFFKQNKKLILTFEIAINILFFFYEICKFKYFFAENLVNIYLIVRLDILFFYFFFKVISNKYIKKKTYKKKYFNYFKNIEIRDSLIYIKLNLKKKFKVQLNKYLKQIKYRYFFVIKKVFYFLIDCFLFDIKIKKILKIKKNANFCLGKIKNFICKKLFLNKNFCFELINNSYEKILGFDFKKKRVEFEIKKTFVVLKLCSNFFINKNLKCYSRNNFKSLKIIWKNLKFRKKLISFYSQIKHFEMKINLLAINSLKSGLIFKISEINNLYSEFFLKKSVDFVKSKINHLLVFLKSFTHKIHRIRISEFLNFLFDLDIFLKLIYILISNGSIIEIDSIDQGDPYKQGITLSIKPVNKNWKILSCLSGGEKSISSLSLLFSLQIVKPSFLYLMDEIDAALDFINVNKISRYILVNNQNFQLIMISLRKNMLNKPGHLIFVYKIGTETKIFISNLNKNIFFEFK
jgi:hypothetical protein